MFDIAWSEMVVIAVVALVVVGPRDLPPLLRQLGRLIGAVKRMASDFHGQFNDALKEAELDGLKKELDELRRSASSSFSDISRNMSNDVESPPHVSPPVDDTVLHDK
jgi:sec-independent protein translocase protein TatB